MLTGLRNVAVWDGWIKHNGKKAKNLEKLDRDGRNAEILKYVDKPSVLPMKTDEHIILILELNCP